VRGAAVSELSKLPHFAPAQFKCVVNTVFRNGALTVDEIARVCDIDASVVQRVIDGLVRRGLLKEVRR
jgi:predicted transcriptional regulator